MMEMAFTDCSDASWHLQMLPILWTNPAGTVRKMYVHCTYSWYNVRTMYVHCTYSACWEEVDGLSSGFSFRDRSGMLVFGGSEARRAH